MNRAKINLPLLIAILFLFTTAGTVNGNRPGNFSKETLHSRFNTGWFYFLIDPTSSGKPNYISQVVSLTYKDPKELRAKQDSCVLLLRKAAGNPAGYNDRNSAESATEPKANKDRTAKIKDLQSLGVTVIQKTI